MNFEEVYQQYFSYVYRFILKLSRNEDIAEDITSETFFKALKSIKQFNGNCSVSVWLCQIAKNTYFNYQKKQSKLVYDNENEAFDMVDITQNIEDSFIVKYEVDRARKYIHCIAEPYKEVFMWRYYGEMNFREIAELFGKSENWACVIYYRARKMLMEKMGDSDER